MKRLAHNLTVDWVAVTNHVAVQTNTHAPPWSTPLMVIGIVGLAIAAIPYFIDCGERRRRWLYWLGFVVGTALIALALSWRGWGVSVGMCFTGAFIAVLFAFFYDSSLLKFGARQISYTRPNGTQSGSSNDQTAETDLGAVPARNHWWVIAIGSVVTAYGVYLIGWAWQLSLLVGFAVIFAATSGWLDASQRLPIARGQKVQFALASVASLMMFALPLVAYLAAYFSAKKWSAPGGRHTIGGNPDETLEPN